MRNEPLLDYMDSQRRAQMEDKEMKTRLEEIKEFVEDILGSDDDMVIAHVVIALERIVEYLKLRE